MNAPAEKITLDLADPLAVPAIAAYAEALRESDPERAAALHLQIVEVVTKDDCYITVPEHRIDGTDIIVPSFRVAQFPAGRGLNDIPISTPEAMPWNNISFEEAERVCNAAGRPQISVLRAIAINQQINAHDENWTGGKIGEGEVFKGIHASEVSAPVPGNHEPAGKDQRTWHVLANGERIYHWVGNLYQYMRDDLHGDEKGLVRAGGLPKDSLLLTLPPYPSMEKGQGCRPDSYLEDWSGYALIRGGRWCSNSYAGVFALSRFYPRVEWDYVGFRSTKPIGR